jgi:thiol:disulfide interchange protein DsbD
MDPGWHTYWQNPGASGTPTTIEWKLPAGITAGKPEWPVPEKLPDPELTTYIYRDEVVVLIPLKLAADVKPGTADIQAKVSWLECAVQCIPGKASVQTSLTVGSGSKPSPDAPLIAAWLKKLPKRDDSLGARAWWEKPATGDLRPLVLEWASRANREGADFYPDASDAFEVQAQVEQVPTEAGKIAIRKPIKKLSGDWPKGISGLLLEGTGPAKVAYQVDLGVGTTESSAVGTSSLANPVAEVMPPASLWKNLLYAFIGGLILNVMPCVLPVIALKILSFVGQAKDDPVRARFLGLVYAAGVLVYFLA